MKKILVIDDDPAVRNATMAALRKNGYEVVGAGDGTEGLALTFAEHPHLVLSDVNMARTNGFGVLKELRSRPETAGIPVILMTGEPQKADARFSMEMGADDYLQKPFRMEQLLAAVGARLDRCEAVEAKNRSERVNAEEKLRLLTSALEAAANGIVITQRTGKILWVNQAFTQLTGYESSEVIDRTPSMMNSGRQTPEFYAGMWDTILAGAVWHGELINRRKDGSHYYEEMTITPVRNAAGGIQNFIAIKQDISDRKKFEQALAAERDLLQSLMDNLPDHIYFKDDHSRFTRINRAHARHLGLQKPEEAIGKSDAHFFPLREARQKLVDEQRLLVTGEPILGLIEKSTTATEVKWVSSTKVPIYGEDGKINGLVGISRDITEAKRAEAELQRKTDVLESQMHSSIDGILVVDERGRKTFQNQRMADLLKIPQAIADDVDDDKQRRWVVEAVKNPEQFIEKVIYLNSHRDEISRDEIEIKDGTILDRYSAPMMGKGGEYFGRMWIFRDITERRRADEALKEQLELRERLAKIATNVPGIIYAFRLRPDGSTCLPYVSPTMEEFYGVPAENLHENASPVFEMIHADDQAHMQASIAESARTMQPWQDEFRVRHPKKGLFWVGGQSTPERQPDGSILWHGFMSDISERKRVEEALRESKHFAESIAQNSTSIIYLFDLATRRNIYSNHGVAEFLGYSREKVAELGDKLLPTIIHPDDQVRISQHYACFASVPDGQVVDLEYRIKHVSGRWHWVWSRDTIFKRRPDGTAWQIMGTAQDITERKQVEEELQWKTAFLEAQVNSSIDGTLVVDELGDKILQNQRMTDLFKIPKHLADDKAAKTQRQWIADMTTNPAQFMEKILYLYTQPNETSRDELALKDGTVLDLYSSSVIGKDGKYYGRIWTFRDITARKQAERERQMMELQLRQSQKLETVGQLAAGIAHEINTPTQYVGDNTRFVKDSFTAISKVLKSHIELLAAARQNVITPELLALNEEIVATSDLEYLCEQIPSALKETLEGVERVSKIVRAMKEFSHPGGKEKTAADLNRAIESTVTVARNEWKYVADLKLELEPGLPPVPCFIGEFNQCILNLIVNAAHAIGDVVRAAPGSKGLITVRTQQAGDHVEVRVTDTGTGIPEASRPKIFEPFFTTKEVGKGTGQGLAMVYGSIVKLHGGTVTFETEVGRGTAFIIRLPLNFKVGREEIQPGPKELMAA